MSSTSLYDPAVSFEKAMSSTSLYDPAVSFEKAGDMIPIYKHHIHYALDFPLDDLTADLTT
jgi:hypothetical protein